jgi:hypothetical protein
MNEFQYIYFLQDKSKDNIYKIGKTKFPKDSILILKIACHDNNVCEKEILVIFKKKFIERKDIGVDYFQGDCRRMNLNIISIVNKHFNSDNDNDDDDDDDSKSYCRAQRRYLQKRFT